MNRVRRFLQLSAKDKILLVRCSLLVWATWLALRVVPFRVMSRWSSGASEQNSKLLQPQKSIASVVWAIKAAARYLPKSGNCLAQALTAQRILGKSGYPSSVRLGVARGQGGEFLAHAWLEVDGKVVIGGSDSTTRFVPLPPLEQETR